MRPNSALLYSWVRSSYIPSNLQAVYQYPDGRQVAGGQRHSKTRLYMETYSRLAVPNYFRTIRSGARLFTTTKPVWLKVLITLQCPSSLKLTADTLYPVANARGRTFRFPTSYINILKCDTSTAGRGAAKDIVVVSIGGDASADAFKVDI